MREYAKPIKKKTTEKAICQYCLDSSKDKTEYVWKPAGEQLEEAKSLAKSINRDRKIDSILFDEDYEELKLEDTEEYQEYLKSGLASVQPISAPTGLLFYLDFKYDNKK